MTEKRPDDLGQAVKALPHIDGSGRNPNLGVADALPTADHVTASKARTNAAMRSTGIDSLNHNTPPLGSSKVRPAVGGRASVNVHEKVTH